MKMRSLFAAATLLVGLTGGPAFAQYYPYPYPPAPPFPVPLPAPPVPMKLFTLGGLVGTQLAVTSWTLQQLPPVTQNVTYAAGSSVSTHSYAGVLLWDLLQKAAGGITVDSSKHNDILSKIIVVTAADGYVVSFTAGEIDPDFGGNQVIVATAEDGQPLAAGDAPAVIVAPGDKKGGRFINRIVSIVVKNP